MADDNEGAIPVSDDDPETSQEEGALTQENGEGQDQGDPGQGDEDDQGDQDQGEGDNDPSQQGPSVQGATPGAAQSGGSDLSELLALIRAVNSYGMRMAQQQGGPAQPQSQQPQQVQSYADGGMIGGDEPDQDEGNSSQEATEPDAPQSDTPQDTRSVGAIPDTPDEASQPQAQPQISSGSEMGEQSTVPWRQGVKSFMDATSALDPRTVPQNAKNILDYLRGSKSVDGNTAAAIGYSVDPNGALPPVTKKMKMVQYAYQKGLTQSGDPRTAMDVALGVLQHQRKEYDMWRTGAAVKLSQSDVASAVDAANKAFQAPFGDNVHFAQSDGGVTATVTDAQGNVQGTFPMHTGQFDQLLKSAGKFDNLIHNGIFDTLSSLSKPTPGPYEGNGIAGIGPNATYASKPQSTQPQGDMLSLPPEYAKAGVTPEMWKMSNDMFPWLSQNTQRLQWVSNELQKNQQLTGKENVARIVSNGRTDRTMAAQQGQDRRQQVAQEGQTSRQGQRLDQASARQEVREAGQDRRQEQRQEAIGERFDKGWEQRTQAAFLKRQGDMRTKDDPVAAGKRKTAQILLGQHQGDPQGYRRELAQYGIDYDKDIMGVKPAPTAAQKVANPKSGTGGTGGKKVRGPDGQIYIIPGQ